VEIKYVGFETDDAYVEYQYIHYIDDNIDPPEHIYILKYVLVMMNTEFMMYHQLRSMSMNTIH